MASHETNLSSTQSRDPRGSTVESGANTALLKGVGGGVIGVLNAIPMVLGVALMLGISGIVCANVVARYVFNSGLIWADEASRFMLIWVTFLGAAALVRLGEHITVDVFVSYMPGAVQAATYVLTQLLSAFLAVVLIWQGIEQVGKQAEQISPAMQINMGTVYTVVPFAGLYMLAYSLANLAALRTRARSPRRGLEGTEV